MLPRLSRLFMRDTTLCQCGCREVVRPGKRFRRGHNNRVMPDDIRRRISRALMGRKVPQDAIDKRRRTMFSRKELLTPLPHKYGKSPAMRALPWYRLFEWFKGKLWKKN